MRSPNDLRLDIGTPSPAHADAMREAIGGVYVGIGLHTPDVAPAVGARRQFHHIGLSEPFAERLNQIVGSRSVASITLLDRIERMADLEEVLQALADFARAKGALVAISASNHACLDAGVDLVFGRMDSRGEPKPKESMTRFIDDARLTRLLGDAGLHAIDRDDVISRRDEFQHPLLRPGVPLGDLLFDSARRANPAAMVREFVWLCMPGPRGRAFVQENGAAPERPFLTAVIRTQGRRLHTLLETLVCLTGQTSDDFEALIVAHKVDAPSLAAVRRLVADMADNLRGKIRLLEVEEGDRARPLNVGFEYARGEYIAILDDDDIPMAHWVAEFSELARNHRGRVLRTACVQQDLINVEVSGKRGLRATGGLAKPYPPDFDLLEHLLVNRSPPICLAFPREAFHVLGLRFDERLSTSEDWDFLLQAAALCGVADLPEITCIYRQHDENSRAILPEKQWDKDYKLIRSKLENTSIILPKGESSRVIALVEASHQLGQVESERDEAAYRLRAAASERDGAVDRLRVAEAQRDDALNRAHIATRLAKAMRRHVKRKLIAMRLRRALSFWLPRRQARLGAKIQEYDGYLRKL